MTHKNIMTWGKKWHYPHLWIGAEATPQTRETLLHGKEHYEALRHSKTRQALAGLRIDRWNARLARAQVDSVLSRVDEALTREHLATPETVGKMEEERIEV